MSEEFKAKCKCTFQDADADKSNTLTRFELCKVMQKLGCKMSVAELADWFGNVDQNQDDKLTFEEFWAALSKRDPAEVKECELRKCFQDIDTDGSGTISAAELKAKMQQLDPKCAEHVEHAIKKADKNKDGMIDYDEFLLEWRKK